jgi:hypothetical protein
MNAAAEIRRNLRQIAAALELPTAPDFLTGEQIAQAARLKDAHTLSASVERGVRLGDKRWLAYRAVIKKGAHRVPSAEVAHWMAIAAGRLPMPPGTGRAAMPGSMWSGGARIHRCRG